MTVVVIFLAAVATIAAWWLSRQRLASMPWLEVGVGAEFPRTQASTLAPAKLGLGLFLAVATCLFALLASAYLMRADNAVPDLARGIRQLPPVLLWANTGALVIAGVALHGAAVAARSGQRDIAVAGMLVGAAATLTFLAGQLTAWRLLATLAASPANAFFYVLTGAHLAHVLGGLAGLGRTLAKALRGATLRSIRLGTQLCAWYWHFLLLVWIAVFALLLGGADALSAFCRGLVT